MKILALLTAAFVLALSLAMAIGSTATGSDSGWTQMNPTPAPSARAYHKMAYDSESDRVILFGGGLASDHSGHIAETWAYDFDSDRWSIANPAVRPEPRESFGMAYDAESDRVVIFGGWSSANLYGFNDTWAYDYNNNIWTDMKPPEAPSPRWGGCMEYDSSSDRIVFVGGHIDMPTVVYYRETWAYDYNANTWTNLTAPGSPSKSNWCALAYDSESDRIVLFGGQGVSIWGISDETWAYNYDANTWTILNPSTKPPPRWFHAMAYDAESDRVVLFGGELVLGSADYVDTWVFDLNADRWTNLNLEVRPTGRSGSAMAYDARSDRVVLFGGDPLNNETWALNTPLEPDTVEPIVAITSPTEGAALASQEVTVMGTASDDVGVDRVELSGDGVTWIVATGTTSWTGTLTLSEGANTILARAFDAAGNNATATVSVTVVLPPRPSFPWLAVVGAAGVVAAIGAILFLRRRRREA